MSGGWGRWTPPEPGADSPFGHHHVLGSQEQQQFGMGGGQNMMFGLQSGSQQGSHEHLHDQQVPSEQQLQMQMHMHMHMQHDRHQHQNQDLQQHQNVHKTQQQRNHQQQLRAPPGMDHFGSAATSSTNLGSLDYMPRTSHLDTSGVDSLAPLANAFNSLGEGSLGGSSSTSTPWGTGMGSSSGLWGTSSAQVGGFDSYGDLTSRGGHPDGRHTQQQQQQQQHSNTFQASTSRLPPPGLGLSSQLDSPSGYRSHHMGHQHQEQQHQHRQNQQSQHGNMSPHFNSPSAASSTSTHPYFSAPPTESLASLQIFDTFAPSPSTSPVPGSIPSSEHANVLGSSKLRKASKAASVSSRASRSESSVSGGPKSLEDDIEELREKLVARQRKTRIQEETLLKPSQTQQQSDFDVDAELARLQGNYRSPESPGTLDVDDLLARVQNRKPLHLTMMNSGGPSPGSAAAMMAASKSSSTVSPNSDFTPPSASSLHLNGQGSDHALASDIGHAGGTSSSEIFLPAARREQISASLRTVPGSQAVQGDLARLSQLALSHTNNSEYETLMHSALEVFVSAQGQLGRLLMHRTANYAISKLFEVLSPRDRLQFLQEIKNKLSRIAQHLQGTFALQKIISALNDPEHLKLIQDGLRFEVRSLALDRNATFTLQKLFSSPLRGDLTHFSLSLLLLQHEVHDESLESLIRQITSEDVEYFRQACLNKHGAMLLTAFIRNCPDISFALLVHIMQPNLVDAACDQFGNYVVQKALERACTTEEHTSLALLITNALCFPDETLIRVATDSFGVKVFLSALSLSADVRDQITARIFSGDSDPASREAQITTSLMCNAEASTLLKRVIRLQQDSNVRATHTEVLWKLLPFCTSLKGTPDYERWVHFLERS